MKNISTPASLAGDAIALDTWRTLTAKVHKCYPQPDQIDLDNMERYCHYQSIYHAARADVAKNGAFLRADNGIAYKNPAMVVMHQSQGHLLKLGAKLHHLLDRPAGEPAMP